MNLKIKIDHFTMNFYSPKIIIDFSLIKSIIKLFPYFKILKCFKNSVLKDYMILRSYKRIYVLDMNFCILTNSSIIVNTKET